MSGYEPHTYSVILIQWVAMSHTNSVILVQGVAMSYTLFSNTI